MADQASKPRVPNAGSWRKGMPSPNPAGRPRAPAAFADRVRERVDPDLVIDLAMKVAEDETLSPAARLNALWPLIDRGFIKPPVQLDAHLTSGIAPRRDYSAFSADEKRELLARIRAAPLLASGDEPSAPAEEP